MIYKKKKIELFSKISKLNIKSKLFNSNKYII